jgi:hypothetical protein
MVDIMTNGPLDPLTIDELYTLNDFLTGVLVDRGFTLEESLAEFTSSPCITYNALDDIVHHVAAEFLSALLTGPTSGAAITLEAS